MPPRREKSSPILVLPLVLEIVEEREIQKV
jgi:hypothetical protein